MSYGYNNIIESLESSGVSKGDVLYVMPSLWSFPLYTDGPLKDLPKYYYKAIRQCIGEEGTLVVSTCSTNLCNTDVVFNLDETPSYLRGAFCEYVRTLNGSFRSFHPFNSYAAIGPKAKMIVDSVGRISFGPETPEGRMVEIGAKVLMLGLSPHSCSTVHLVEHAVGSPYRYMKEFMHPVLRNEKVEIEPFYFHVYYRDMDLKGDGNRKIVKGLEKKMSFNRTRLDEGEIYVFSIKEYYEHGIKLFTENPYIWCEHSPKIRPYQK